MLSQKHRIFCKSAILVGKYCLRNATEVRGRLFSSTNLLGFDENQLKKIAAMDEALRKRHDLIESTLSAQELNFARRKRIIYRSKQRGLLEVDILLGTWATQNVPSLSEQDLNDYEKLLNEETIDIFNYISRKDTLPALLEHLPVVQAIQKFAFEMKMTEPEDYEKIKKNHNLT